MESNLEHLMDMFSKMRAGGWDTSKPLKWGFFFMNSNMEPLEVAFNVLKDHQYKLESIHQADETTFVMQLSKTEILTPLQLHARNQSFNQLAEQLHIDTYDGWDVGKPD
jgi:hypothetical protein